MWLLILKKVKPNFSQLDPLLVYLRQKHEDQKFARSLEIGGTFLLVAFFIFFAIKPTFLTISKLVGDIRHKKNLTLQLRKKIDDIIAAQDLFAQVQEKYYLVDESLPNHPGFYQLNNLITSTAAQHQIYFDKLQYNLSEGEIFYKTNLTQSTSFTPSISFLTELSHSRRLLDLSGLSLSVNEASSSGQQLNLSLPLSIYYWSK
jgi:hypothetical protein